jgi:sialate O-acetylesterase
VREDLRTLLADVARLQVMAHQVQSLDGPWRFRTDPDDLGMTAGWALPSFDDSDWERVDVPSSWEQAGHPGYDGVAWYRRQVWVPLWWAGLDLLLDTAGVDDQDRTSYQGEIVGETLIWNRRRSYLVPASLVLPGQANTVAVRVTDGTGDGGLYRSLALVPHPVSLAATLSEGGLVGFMETAALVDATPVRLLVVKQAGLPRLVLDAGRPPFVVERGTFPRAEEAEPLTGSPLSARTLVDTGAGPRAAWRTAD